MKIFSGYNFLIIVAVAVIFAVGNPVQIQAEETFELLPDAGDKCPIGSDYYFIYSFDKKPQLGTVILKVELYNKAGQRDTGLKISGASGMPSMKGHHDSGDVEFKLNKKGDYLLPVNVVMPGDWEIKLKFQKGDQIIYRGSIRFDI
jgi:hypothetical protein